MIQKVTWIYLFLFLTGISGLNAQVSLNIKGKTGTQATYGLTDINKIVFNAGNMTVSKKDGTTMDFALINVQNLNFTNLTSIGEVKSNAVTGMILFPNPVKDNLQIRYESVTGNNVQITLMDIQGKTVFQQEQMSQAGLNQWNIPVEKFHSGFYICRLISGKNTEISKFIKL